VHVVPRGWTLPVDDLRAGEADVSFLRGCFDRRDLIVEHLAWEPRSVLLCRRPLPSRLEIGIPADAATPVAKQFVEYARDRWQPMAT
jgi:DNA-binding transcriptional LysR family regulator